MSQPVAHVGSSVSGSGKKPSGTMVSGNQSKVFVHGKAVCVVGDTASNGGKLVEGSSKFKINGMPVARVNDSLDYGGKVTSGDSSMLIS